MNNTGIIILAAGKSSRLGSAKQLLQFNNKTLLQHVVDEAIASGAEPIVVVTGSYAEEVSKIVSQAEIITIYNESWEEGMASSIATGVQTIRTKYDYINKVIIAVSDQPFVTSSLFMQLHQKQSDSGKGMVACMYSNTLGTPVLFTQKYFGELLNLQGDEGAKKIVKANPDDVALIDFPQGNIDIDTISDYQNLLDNQKHVL